MDGASIVVQISGSLVGYVEETVVVINGSALGTEYPAINLPRCLCGVYVRSPRHHGMYDELKFVSLHY